MAIDLLVLLDLSASVDRLCVQVHGLHSNQVTADVHTCCIIESPVE